MARESGRPSGNPQHKHGNARVGKKLPVAPDTPQNRKQRRAAAKLQATKVNLKSP
jgi:hypothetical protein